MANSVQRQRRHSLWLECAGALLFFFGVIAVYGLVDYVSRAA